MTSKRQGNTRNIARKKSDENTNATKLRGELKLGDVVWVKIRNSLWWPAQVVDKNMVSKTCKPKKKLTGEVLVRLYGSYKFLYFDPVKYCSEFEKILKENKGCYSEILQKSLEKDISYMKKRVSEPREKVRAEAPEDKRAKQDESRNNHSDLGKQPDVSMDKLKTRKSEKATTNGETKQDGVKKNRKEGSIIKERNNSNEPSPVSNPVVKSPDLSVRRFRVMQSLGLVAPCGSPFLSNGLKLSIS